MGLYQPITTSNTLWKRCVTRVKTVETLERRDDLKMKAGLDAAIGGNHSKGRTKFIQPFRCIWRTTDFYFAFAQKKNGSFRLL